MHSSFRSVALSTRWAFASALLLTIAGTAQAQEMDFGGEEDAPPPEEGEVVVDLAPEAEPPEAEPPEAEPPEAAELAAEPTRAPAYSFAITADEDLRQIAHELDSALRDVLAGSDLFSSASGDQQLNGVSDEAIEALREARELFESGRGAYENLELEEAVERFSQALATFEEQVAHVTDLNDISECLLYLGAAEALSGDARQARVYFQRMLIVDPERRPDTDVFPPQVTEAFDYEASRLDRIREGVIQITSVPDGSDVFVDGIYQGPAPQELRSFKAGRHYIRVRRQGFIEAGQAVEVGSRRPTTMEFSLEQATIGPALTERLGELATQMTTEDEGVSGTVSSIGELLGLEVVMTALVFREEQGVMVRLNAWEASEGRSVVEERVGPFEADAVLIAGDVQPSFEETIQRIYRALNVQQADDEPIIEQNPDLPPPPPSRRPVWQRWWFWTIIGTVVVGAGVGLGVGLGTQPDPPGRTQGEVIFDL